MIVLLGFILLFCIDSDDRHRKWLNLYLLETSMNDKPIELIKAGSNEVEFLVFHLGDQKYGMNVSKVRQIMIFDHAKISEVPNQPEEYLGLMPFREHTIAVIDLAKHLRKNKIATSTPELLIVTEFNKRVVGFVVSAVDRIERCSWEKFQSMQDSACNSDTAQTVGIIRLGETVVLILDLETIMGVIDPSMNIGLAESSTKRSALDRRSISILHCDDSPIVQKVLANALREAGYATIKTFPSAVDALSYLEENSDNVDIILSDIEMPKMDGLAFCLKVKETEKTRDLPLVFFSSTVDNQMHSKCLSVGADGAFSKPEISMVIDSIDILVEEHRKQSLKSSY